jgi:hypothetical protein
MKQINKTIENGSCKMLEEKIHPSIFEKWI